MSKHLATVGMKTGSRRDSHLLWPIGGERMSAKFHGITSWDSCFWHRYFSLNQTGEHTDRQTKQAVSWAHKTKPLKKLYPIMGNSLISPVTEDKWKCSSDSAYWDDIIRLQSLKPECRWNNGRFRPVADVGELSATACKFSHRWMNCLALMLQWVTCLLSMHIFIYVWGNREWDSEKYWDYQKVRSCQMRWMQDFSFGAQITHKHAQRWRDGSLEAPVFHLPCAHVLRCEWTYMHVLAKNRCEFMCAHAHTHKVKLYSQVSKCIHPTGLCSNQQD